MEERTRELIVKGEEGRDVDNQSLRQTRVSISNCVSNSFESKRRIFLSPFIIRKGFFQNVKIELINWIFLNYFFHFGGTKKAAKKRQGKKITT